MQYGQSSVTVVYVSSLNTLDEGWVHPETLIANSEYVTCGPALSDAFSSSHCKAILPFCMSVVLKLDGAADGTIQGQ